MDNPYPAPTREVLTQDALDWLSNQTELPGTVITSLPSYDEMNMHVPAWKTWFQSTIELILGKLTKDNFAIFYQSDVRFPIYDEVDKKKVLYTEWLDKGYLVINSAEKMGFRLVFHKIMLTHPLGTLKTGRAGYSHLICVTPKTLQTPVHLSPDVCDRGEVLWKAGAGLNAMIIAVQFAKKLNVQCIIDPFCGHGTTLAVANYFGISSIGVERHDDDIRLTNSHQKRNCVTYFCRSIPKSKKSLLAHVYSSNGKLQITTNQSEKT